MPMVTPESATTGATDAHPWDGVVAPDDVAALRAAGYGGRTRFGGAPALLVVDATYGFVGVRAPLADSVREYPDSCGEAAWLAVDANAVLIAAARAAGAPVAYTVDVSSAAVPADDVWRHKRAADRPRRSDETEIVAELAPEADDIVVSKTRPSGFFGTDLVDRLRDLGVRDVVVCGGTTSGCVRATVVDAFSHGFGVAVAQDAVFDRSATSHAVTLFDINEKYGDVVPLTAATRLLNGVAAVNR
jgi:maleamate amidohydrolase